MLPAVGMVCASAVWIPGRVGLFFDAAASETMCLIYVGAGENEIGDRRVRRGRRALPKFILRFLAVLCVLRVFRGKSAVVH